MGGELKNHAQLEAMRCASALLDTIQRMATARNAPKTVSQARPNVQGPFHLIKINSSKKKKQNQIRKKSLIIYFSGSINDINEDYCDMCQACQR